MKPALPAPPPARRHGRRGGAAGRHFQRVRQRHARCFRIPSAVQDALFTQPVEVPLLAAVRQRQLRQPRNFRRQHRGNTAHLSVRQQLPQRVLLLLRRLFRRDERRGCQRGRLKRSAQHLDWTHPVLLSSRRKNIRRQTACLHVAQTRQDRHVEEQHAHDWRIWRPIHPRHQTESFIDNFNLQR